MNKKQKIMNRHFKNTLILLAIIGVVTVAGWINFEKEKAAITKREAIDDALNFFNDSFLKTPALPFLIDHYKYGMAMVDGSTVIPIDMDEYKCWQVEYNKWKIFYQQELQKVDSVKRKDAGI